MVKKIIDWIAAIPKDKLLHFICSFIIAQIIYAITEFFQPMWLSFIITLLGTAIIGALKECIDWLFGGSPTWSDFWTDLIGDVAGLIVVLLIVI